VCAAYGIYRASTVTRR